MSQPQQCYHSQNDPWRKQTLQNKQACLPCQSAWRPTGSDVLFCHLERNEITEIRGCHRGTSFLSSKSLLWHQTYHTVMTETELSAHGVSACDRWMVQFIKEQNVKSAPCIRIWNNLSLTDTAAPVYVPQHTICCQWLTSYSQTEPWTCNALQTELCAAVVVRHFSCQDLQTDTSLAPWKQVPEHLCCTQGGAEPLTIFALDDQIFTRAILTHKSLIGIISSKLEKN